MPTTNPLPDDESVGVDEEYVDADNKSVKARAAGRVFQLLAHDLADSLFASTYLLSGATDLLQGDVFVVMPHDCC